MIVPETSPLNLAPNGPIDPETAWSAVATRDASFDGRFVYAVRSTGIYCRPACPSRRPSRTHVAFFADAPSATRAGFRPCLRCRPDEPVAPARAALDRARAFIDAHLDESLRLGDVARAAHLSPSHLQRTFKAALGLSPREYVASRRAERFKRAARASSSVTDAIYEAGYSSGSRLYEIAGGRLGMTPAAYRAGGEGVAIRYAVVDSPHGRLLVASTERGICSVQLGDDDEALHGRLRREYPAASISRDERSLAPIVAQALASLAGRGARPRLDVPGTPFQWRVWKALQAIPRGQTRSYAELAASIGSPRAVRAVAQACAKNHVALLVPCHRIVRKDGSPGGYAWGAQRKRRILASERGDAGDATR